MRTNHLTHTLLLFCLSLLTTSAFGQSNSWQLLHEEEGVQFYGMDTYCSNDAEPKANHFALLKIVNNNAQSVKVNFGFAIQYAEDCSGCDQDSEFFTALEVPANTTLEGSCNDQTGKLSRIIRNLNIPGGWTYQSTKIVYPLID